MSEQGASQSSESHEVQVWDPDRLCRKVSAADAALSKGFLRCRPEKWFPGLSAQWLPIAHALGCEIALSDIKPMLTQPPRSGVAFAGRVADEPLLIALDHESSATILAEAVPGAEGLGEGVVLEYLMRRVFYSLVTAWTGPQTSAAVFVGAVGAESVETVASVRVTCSLNTSSVVVWFGLGQRMVQTLDGLWRRQVQSTARSGSAPSNVRLEVAQLGVPPQMLSDYLKPGTVIDLEVKASDMLTVRVGGKVWMPARMVNVDGLFGAEIVPGAVSAPSTPEGTTRLSVELGGAQLDPAGLAELGQAGAILATKNAVGEEVILSINQEAVGKARLCLYEGRFAIEVI